MKKDDQIAAILSNIVSEFASCWTAQIPGAVFLVCIIASPGAHIDERKF
jgi:hypothetical protein